MRGRTNIGGGGGGLEINGQLKEYEVAAGNTIAKGDFVEITGEDGEFITTDAPLPGTWIRISNTRWLVLNYVNTVTYELKYTIVDGVNITHTATITTPVIIDFNTKFINYYNNNIFIIKGNSYYIKLYFLKLNGNTLTYFATVNNKSFLDYILNDPSGYSASKYTIELILASYLDKFSYVFSIKEKNISYLSYSSGSGTLTMATGSNVASFAQITIGSKESDCYLKDYIDVDNFFALPNITFNMVSSTGAKTVFKILRTSAHSTSYSNFSGYDLDSFDYGTITEEHINVVGYSTMDDSDLRYQNTAVALTDSETSYSPSTRFENVFSDDTLYFRAYFCGYIKTNRVYDCFFVFVPYSKAFGGSFNLVYRICWLRYDVLGTSYCKGKEITTDITTTGTYIKASVVTKVDTNRYKIGIYNGTNLKTIELFMDDNGDMSTIQNFSQIKLKDKRIDGVSNANGTAGQTISVWVPN